MEIEKWKYRHICKVVNRFIEKNKIPSKEDIITIAEFWNVSERVIENLFAEKRKVYIEVSNT